MESVGCCGSGSHALKALSWGIMRQAPICHFCLCPHFLQCVPWPWASPNCMSRYMTKQSPELSSQPFMAEPLCLPPISKHLLCAPVPGSFRWACVAFLNSAELHSTPLNCTLYLGIFLMFNQQGFFFFLFCFLTALFSQLWKSTPIWDIIF